MAPRSDLGKTHSFNKDLYKEANSLESVYVFTYEDIASLCSGNATVDLCTKCNQMITAVGNHRYLNSSGKKVPSVLNIIHENPIDMKEWRNQAWIYFMKAAHKINSTKGKCDNVNINSYLFEGTIKPLLNWVKSNSETYRDSLRKDVGEEVNMTLSSIESGSTDACFVNERYNESIMPLDNVTDIMMGNSGKVERANRGVKRHVSGYERYNRYLNICKAQELSPIHNQ